MSRQKGSPKTGGRKKGTLNRFTSIRNQLLEADFNIGLKIKELYYDATKIEEKIRIIEIAAKYYQAVPTIEIPDIPEDEETIDASVDDLMKAATT